jgi:hypothetical protein
LKNVPVVATLLLKVNMFNYKMVRSLIKGPQPQEHFSIQSTQMGYAFLSAYSVPVMA